jgi:anti-anti-sigma factor
MMHEFAAGMVDPSHLAVDCDGPWVVVHLTQDGPSWHEPAGLAQCLWQLAQQRGSRHVILELSSVGFISSSMMGEFVRINKRLLQNGGQLRLCGLRDACQEALHISRLDEILACYHARGEAVAGHGRIKSR